MTTGPDPRIAAGRKGGRSRSPKKLAAIARNAKRGGRPRGVLVEVTPTLTAPLHLRLAAADRDKLLRELLSDTSDTIGLTILPHRKTRTARIYDDAVSRARKAARS